MVFLFMLGCLAIPFAAMTEPGAHDIWDDNGVRFDESPRALLLVDDSYRYVDANNAALRLLGFSREALLGMGPKDHLEQIGSAEYEDMGRRFKEVGEAAGLYRLKSGDGRTLALLVHTVANVAPGRHLVDMELRTPSS